MPRPPASEVFRPFDTRVTWQPFETTTLELLQWMYVETRDPESCTSFLPIRGVYQTY